MTRGKTPSPSASLHEQTVRQHCRALKMPTVAGQFETLAQALLIEGLYVAINISPVAHCRTRSQNRQLPLVLR